MPIIFRICTKRPSAKNAIKRYSKTQKMNPDKKEDKKLDMEVPLNLEILEDWNKETFVCYK